MWSSPFSELEAQHVAHRPADHVGSPRPVSSRTPAARADDAGVAVADDEGRVGRGVVIVEKLEQETEAAFGAALGAGCETGGPLP